jgi:DNA-binding NtrC family response regulator
MKKHSILVVEDDGKILTELIKVFEDEGYDVSAAENGQTALELWENHIYDIILVDLRIPGIDGRDLINQIKSRQPLTQIVILSGQGRDGDLIDAINQHVFAYLPKPAELNDILKAVADSIKQRDPVLMALDQLADKSPDEPILLVGKKSYTPKQLYDEVRKGTSFGKEYHEEFYNSLLDFEPPKLSIDDMLNF